MVETATVPTRRHLRFNAHPEILGEVRSLAEQPTRQLGHWSLPAICQHLATAMNLCIDAKAGQVDFRAPLSRRILARLFRAQILKRGLPTGVKLPPPVERVLYVEPENLEAAIAALERAIARLRSTTQRSPHPLLGTMSAAQWDQFHLRHAELHLSFIVPE
jgi:hypothetical protein